MSRSNNVEIKNPANRFLEWKGEGGFKYFDKSIGDKGKNVDMPLPFTFLVLDCLSTIKGFSDADQSGYWSNEVRDLKTETLTVRNKKGICAKGLYENVITDRRINGAKYCQSVYIGYLDGQELAIGNIQLTGAALGAWIDFRRKNKVFEGAVKVAKMIECKKGATVYQTPVFEMIAVKPETDEKAKELDKELQKYLSLYFAKNKEHVDAPVQEADIVDAQPPYRPDEVPLENFNDEADYKGVDFAKKNAERKAQPAMTSNGNSIINPDEQDLPF